MLDISNNFETQRKRVQSAINTMLRKGYSIAKANKAIQEKYGVSVKNVGLTKDRNAKRYVSYKSKSAREKAKKAYEENKQKNIHRQVARRDANEIITKRYGSKNNVSNALTTKNIEEMAKATGKDINWETMKTEDYYKALQDVSKYASDMYLDNQTEEEQEKLTPEELELYRLGAEMHKKGNKV